MFDPLLGMPHQVHVFSVMVGAWLKILQSVTIPLFAMIAIAYTGIVKTMMRKHVFLSKSACALAIRGLRGEAADHDSPPHQHTRSTEKFLPQALNQGDACNLLSSVAVLNEKQPSVQELLHNIQTCRKASNINHARLLHDYIKDFGLYPTLGNHLVPLFVDCGSMLDAQQVFDSLVFRNVHSWTSLISGYMEAGKLKLAWYLYKEMQKDKVRPNSYTLVALIKAFSKLKDVREGHNEVICTGLELDLYVGSTLVDTYAKCGSLKEALNTFRMLSVRNVITWNALIAGYVEHGPSYEAIKCLEQMQLENVYPDNATYVSVLKACGSLGDIEHGRIVHNAVFQRGFEGDVSVANTLVDMYGKCSLVEEAGLVFERLPMRDVVSWNALIGAYAEQGLDEKALGSFNKMQAEGFACNSSTFVSVLKACGSVGSSDRGKGIHMEITLKGYESDPMLCSMLVDMYVKHGSMMEVWALFCMLSRRDSVVWNCIIAGYAENGSTHKVLECLEKMQLEGITPNEVTYVNTLKDCGVLGGLDHGNTMYTEIILRGFDNDYIIGSRLMDMYAKHGFLKEAQEIFDKLSHRSVVTWTALIAGYAGYGFGQRALTCFEQSQEESITPNALMFVSVLQSCNGVAFIQKCRELHLDLIKRGLEKDVLIGNTLIQVYAKCCTIVEARRVFDSMSVKTIVSWNSMIKGYGTNDRGDLALQVFDRMQGEHVEPNAVTLTCILHACSHASMVLKGQAIFELLKDSHGIIPTVDNYGCMIDLLSRSGHLYEAEKYLRTMPNSPSEEMWLGLLGASKTHADLDVGHGCFEQLILMDPDCASAYLLLADIYLGAGRLEEAHSIDKLRLRRLSK